jgi:hypothetical protein
MMLRILVMERGDTGWQTVPVIINTDYVVSYAYPQTLKLSDGTIYTVAEESSGELAMQLLALGKEKDK